MKTTYIRTISWRLLLLLRPETNCPDWVANFKDDAMQFACMATPNDLTVAIDWR